MTPVQFLAFYLPQFHPIPENDAWWGKGFTEWTNVAKAAPMFPGHEQPRLPADLGFYDLRVAETREAQARLARAYGIDGFCYWHYWFGNGRRILERPFQEVLESGVPDLPFCLAWANQSWTGIWHGAPDRILIEQTYPGRADEETHFLTVLDAFRDSRYITIDGCPLFIIFLPYSLPDCRAFTDHWRELAQREGLPGLHLVGLEHSNDVSVSGPEANGLDALIIHNSQRVYEDRSRLLFPSGKRMTAFGESPVRALLHRAGNRLRRLRHPAWQSTLPRVCRYRDTLDMFSRTVWDGEYYPCVFPNFDNTPRSGASGVVFHESTPELFSGQVQKALEWISHDHPAHKLVFIKSWNEWAEGNYLEPDQRFGHQFLEVIRRARMPRQNPSSERSISS